MMPALLQSIHWLSFVLLLVLSNQLSLNSAVNSVNIGVILPEDVSLEVVKSQIDRVLNSNKAGRICPTVLPCFKWHQLNSSDVNKVRNTVCDLTDGGVQAVVSSVSSPILPQLVGLLDAAQVPHIAVATDVCTPRPFSTFSLYTSPSCRTRAQVVRDFLRHVIKDRKWKSIVLLQSYAKGCNETRHLILDLSRQFIETQLAEIDQSSKTDYIRSQLSHPRLKASKNFILIGARNTIESVLEQANHLGMLGRKYFWIIFPTEAWWHEKDDVFQRYSASNIVLVEQHWVPGNLCCYPGDFWYMYRSTELRQLSILELKILEAISLLHNVIREEAMKQTPVTMKDTSDENSGYWQQDNGERVNKVGLKESAKFAILDKLKLGSKNGRFTGTSGFDENGNLKSIRYDFYSTYEQTATSLNLIGQWRACDGIQTRRPFFLNQFRDFKGLNIPVAALEHPPFYSIGQTDGQRIHKGLSIDILDELASRLNFSYTIIQPADKSYGNKVAKLNDTWDGMVGMLLKGEVMIAAGPFTVTSERAQVVDFTKSYLEVSSSIVSKRIDIESTNLLQVFTPFTMEIWASIAIAILAVGMTSAFINRFTPFGCKGRQFILENSAFENIWTMYSSLTEQGPTFYPVSTSGRCILGVWWLCSTLLVAMYTAVLAAYLTVLPPSPHIRGLSDLIRHTYVGILVSQGSSTFSLFRDSGLESYQDLWKRIKKAPDIEWEEEALRYVDTGQYVYITDTTSLEYVVSHSCKGYNIAEEAFNKGSYAFTLPKDAPYLQAVNYNMMKILEAGLVDVWKKKWLSSDMHCDQISSSENTTLQLNRVGGVFIIYSVITGCAVVLILCGSFWKRFCKKI